MLIQRILVLMALLLLGAGVRAQTVYDKYVDFNDAIIKHHPDKAIALGTEILNSSEKLPTKTQTKFYAFLAKLYEDDKQADSAIKYYELVVAAEPDYFIAHRALGYLYLAKANFAYLSNTLNIAEQFFPLGRLAVAHLEKDVACNPDKDELEQIKDLYKRLYDKDGLKTLDSRLQQLRGKCVDLLTDQF